MCFVNHSASPPSDTPSSERRCTLAWLSNTAARLCHRRLSSEADGRATLPAVQTAARCVGQGRWVKSSCVILVK